ncbi:single-stranded-DNA-specific exonuclease RecJ [bacterium]|nr:single-stranded-DNA-specific exonuclease RecJ [bacterium]
MQVKEWIYNNTVTSKSEIISRLLESRGIIGGKAQKEFLYPYEMQLIHPNAFNDMETAVERIYNAIETQEKILIYGDFDTDGMTSVSVLYKTLSYLNANVSWYIPDRDDNHGLNTKLLVPLLTKEKPKLVITVDCGTNNVNEVKFLNSFKVDTIITDHHEQGPEIPEAIAIINPKVENALSEKLSANEMASLASLAGCGVAYKLSLALLLKYEKPEFSYNLLPLVAIGTIGDIVPLIGENRYYVKKGIELIEQGGHAGAVKLLKNAGCSIEKGLTSEQIAFCLVPRLNASGRMDTVDPAMKMLLSDNPSELTINAEKLENLNKARQEICNQTFEQAKEMYEKENSQSNAIVLYNPEWLTGIVGIAASKMVETYYKPAFLMTNSNDGKQIKCSARGIDDLNLFDIISYILPDCENGGGHKLAGGFAFNPEYISFEEIKEKLENTVNEMTQGKELTPKVFIDLVLEQGDKGSGVDVELTETLKLLEPYGASNPQPVFAINDVILTEKRLMGENKTHLKLFFEKNGETFECVRWGMGDTELQKGDKANIAFFPQLNTFNGRTSVQLLIKDIYSEVLNKTTKEETKTSESGVLLYDHRLKTDIYPQVDSYIKGSKRSISVFAEDKKILKTLKPYENISSHIVSRLNLQKCDVLMFMDYPSDEILMNEITEKSNAKTIHYFKYTPEKQNTAELIKTVSGMIKYAENQKDGKFEYKKAASFLSCSEYAIKALIESFNECNMIKTAENNEDFCIVKYEKDTDLSKITNTQSYNEFIKELEETENYRKSLSEEELTSP